MTGKVQPGQPFKPNARDINRWTEAADEAAIQRYGQQGQDSPQIPREHLVTLFYVDESKSPRWCLAFAQNSVPGSVQPDLQRPIWNSQDSGRNNVPFGIVPQGSRVGTQDAQVMGVCAAQVYVHDEGHGYAINPPTGNILVSSETGPVRILWRPTAVTKSVSSWSLTGTNTATCNIAAGHRLTSGKFSASWTIGGTDYSRTGIDVVISGNALSLSGGSGDSLTTTAPSLRTVVTGEQTCIVQILGYQPQIGFDSDIDGAYLTSGAVTTLLFDSSVSASVIPANYIWPATVGIPIGTGFEWVASDQAFRCRQPGVYRVHAHVTVSCDTVYALTSTQLQCAAFVVQMYQNTTLIGTDTAVMAPGPNTGGMGSTEPGSATVNIEQWRAFAYDDKLQLKITYTNPATGNPSGLLSGALAVQLLDCRARAQP